MTCPLLLFTLQTEVKIEEDEAFPFLLPSFLFAFGVSLPLVFRNRKEQLPATLSTLIFPLLLFRLSLKRKAERLPPVLLCISPHYYHFIPFPSLPSLFI